MCRRRGVRVSLTHPPRPRFHTEVDGALKFAPSKKFEKHDVIIASKATIGLKSTKP